MRLLIVTPEYPPQSQGGIAAYYGALAPALVRAGCDVTVLVANPLTADFHTFERDGVSIHSVKLARIQECADGMLHLAPAPLYRKWLASGRAAHLAAAGLDAFDIAEVADFGLQFVPFLLDRRSAPIVVVQCHGSIGQISQHEAVRPDLALDHALSRLTEMTVLPMADDIQTYASANAAEWSARLGREVRVAPPPLLPGTLEDDVPARDGVLVVGRIQPWKGPEVLCRAIRVLPESDQPRFQWVGSDTATAPDGRGSFDAWLREQYGDVWGTRIAVTAARPHEQVRRLQRAARLVLVPSVWDVFNLTAAEAMAAGSVVVCSDAAGASDIIRNGDTGFTFKSGDAADLARVLAHAWRLDEPTARAIGARARAAIATTLDPDTVAHSRMQIFNELLRRAPAGPAPADWIQDFFQGGAAGSRTAFLDQLGVRELSRYLGGRIGRRVLSQARSIGMPENG